MREISREEHELLLNLFILKMRYEFYFEFINWENTEYEELMKSADVIILKDCFPMDEVYNEATTSHFDDELGIWKETVYLKYNKIQEV